MGLEAVTYVDDLVITNPIGASDPKSEGDNHLRNIKIGLKNTFPGLVGRTWRTQSKAITYTVLATDNMSRIRGSAAITLNFTAAATLGNGFMFIASADGGAVTLDPNSTETINGSTTLVLADGESALVVCNGTAFVAYTLSTTTLAAFLATAHTWTKPQRGAYVALTSTSGSVAVDLGLSNNFNHTLTENTTLAAPTNAVAGQSGVIEITQHASAAKTLAYNAFWKWEDGTPLSVSATLSSKNVLAYVVDSGGTFATCTLQRAVA